MFAHERHNAILALLEEHRRLEFHALLRLIPVSPATLRRDLAHLEETDRAVRVHGGVLHPSAMPGEPSFRQKAATSMDAKKRIAALAAKTIPPGATVFIDSGTTCLEAGRALRSRSDLTIITNSLPLLAGHDQFRAKLLVLGGEMRSVSGALVGDLALAAVTRLRADVSLIGASGLHPKEGAGTTELLETAVKREWISRSKRRLLLADASKWTQSTAVRFADWSEFTEFYTDRRPPRELPARAVKVVLA
jgi:DeoR/GlpR family transcriptional regulator of sugar metabolism